MPGDFAAPGPWTCEAHERETDADCFVYDLVIYAADGRVRERWDGLRLKTVSSIDVAALPPPLFAPYMERRIKEFVPGTNVRIALMKRDGAMGSARAKRSEHALHRLLGNEISVLHRSDGKPEVNGASVSVAHADQYTLAVVDALACDLELVKARPHGVWDDLLGGTELAQLIASEASEPFERSATRVWCALECIKKAGLGRSMPLTLRTCEHDGYVMLDAGTRTVVTACASLDARSTVLAVLPIVDPAAQSRSLKAYAGNAMDHGKTPPKETDLRARV